ncbi:hypothetical protein B0H13DRAFT_2300483 [Mycena leptocephala]|nr:hypothetical protein B0H13DRAFT_2300483 [Mycena leptocephala]
MSNLPQELVEAIVEEMEIKALVVASTVASHFLAPCQRRLFRSIGVVVCADCSPSRFPRLRSPSAGIVPVVSSLTAFPHLRSYVHDVAIYVSDQAKDKSTASTEVDKLIQVLPAVRSLSMQGFPFQTSWTNLPPCLVSSLHRVIELPTICSFHLSQFRSLPHALVFRALRSFRRFWINDIDLHGSYARQVACNAVSSLGHLRLGISRGVGIHRFFLHAKTQSFLRNLQHLDLTTKQLDSQFLLQWPQESLCNLQHLVLRSVYTSGTPAPLQLPLLPTLQTVDFRVELLQSAHIAMPDWKQIFASILANTCLPTSTPLLECLCLTVHGGGYRIEPTCRPASVPPFDTPDFADRLPSLRQVHCSMRSNVSSRSRDGFVSHMRATFPGPQAAGILTVTA